MDTAIDKFSWRRVWLIGHYMLPTLKKQLILYPLFAVFMAALSQYFCYLGWIQFTGAGIMNTFAGLLFYFAPISLARRDNRFIIAQIPARTTEKFVFLLIYYWIVIGLLTFGLSQLTIVWLEKLLPSTVNPDMRMIMGALTGVLGYKLDFIIVSGFLSGFALQAFALYGVVRAETNRMLTGIGYMIVSYIAMSVISGIVTIILVFVKIGRLEAEYGGGAPVDSAEFAAEVVSDMITPVMTFIMLLFSFIGVVLMHKTYKNIKHRGF